MEISAGFEEVPEHCEIHSGDGHKRMQRAFLNNTSLFDTSLKHMLVPEAYRLHCLIT